MDGQPEGHKESDDREVGTGSRHVQSDEANRRDPHQHVVEEKPRLRGWHSEKPVDDDTGVEESRER